MTSTNVMNLSECFADLDDPRLDRGKRHLLGDLIVTTICAVVASSEDWLQIAEYAKQKEEWLKKFLLLPNGAACASTYERLFARLKPEVFAECFSIWIQAIHQLTKGEVVAIDGKTLRRSYNKANGQPALHMISAWATANRLVLAQMLVEEKSNEITAIPALLQLLHLKGAIVTLDAMGCQKKIVQQIHDDQGDYVIGLKGNQGNLHQQVKDCFEEHCDAEQPKGRFSDCGNQEKGHGRSEERYYTLMKKPASVDPDKEWKGLRSIGSVSRHWFEDGVCKVETRYFITTLNFKDVEKFAESVRRHWGIENSLHWVLDVTFREDDSRVRNRNSAANLAIIRRFAISLLNQDKESKGSIKQKRYRASLNNGYLESLLANSTKL